MPRFADHNDAEPASVADRSPRGDLLFSSRLFSAGGWQRAVHPRTRHLLSFARADQRQPGHKSWIFAVASMPVLQSSELAAEPAGAPAAQVHRLGSEAASIPGIA